MCSRKGTLKRFEWTDFIETKSVKAEYLNFEGPINPSSFQILRDSIVLSIDKRASEGHYVYFHNLTGELITIAGRKGSGPGELLSCKIQISQDEKKLYVFDYLTQQYTIWNTDSVLRQGLNYHPDVIKLDPDIEEVSLLMNLLFLCIILCI